MKHVAIEVENISKRYRIEVREKRHTTLGGALTSWVKSPVSNFKRLRKLSRFTEDDEQDVVWALKNVSFDVQDGDIVGIVGRNGAGKSTLLKIISRITEPTAGRIIIRGLVSSLLEVGTGFHLDLSGRENVYLNGTILGMSKKEIDRKFDEIVAFAEVEKFIDTPVRHYSSGMKVRLAFSVAAHLEPDILIVDEVLAVGDSMFQKRCMGKMGEVARQGRTVLFVSHNLGAVETLCNTGILLEKGGVVAQGDIRHVIGEYTNSLRMFSSEDVRFEGPLKNRILFNRIQINGADPLQQPSIVSPLEPIEFRLYFSVVNAKPFRITLSVFKDNVRIFSLHDTEAKESPSGDIVSIFKIPPRLLRSGLYVLGIGGHETNRLGDWFWQEALCSFEVTNAWDDKVDPINLGIINVEAETARINL